MRPLHGTWVRNKDAYSKRPDRSTPLTLHPLLQITKEYQSFRPGIRLLDSYDLGGRFKYFLSIDC